MTDGEKIAELIALALVIGVPCLIMFGLWRWEKADNQRIQNRMDRRGDAMDAAFRDRLDGKISDSEFDDRYDAAVRLK